ncbi:CusA/CzcA family heavy metal efflux RND transporter [Altererythrobacter sp. TH136]|uniref:efflux RND transporter permease subunit n=1 Tax=Altererythrobacter sp. TH136 TaxID=2067415 RepID=UPI0011650C27|nr:CusA/CzcA family heavy metal efflux RND transporter [Altererythrobacter sp. TH136]QDM40657.1 CusA/CzcA family heavy metal efflux RND transporter [Altererythrobacter sp. TH136]
MIERILDAAIRFRWAVVIVTLIVSAYGVTQLLKLPIDAVPDITNKQVQINTVAPNLGPLDMERLVTFPVETAMAGIPGLEGSRSISRNGFSQVTVVFEDDTDLYFARQQVAERLNQAKGALPEGIEPEMGPVSTGLGEVLMYVVDFAPAGTKANPKVPGRPGFQPDGSYQTPEGELLKDDVAKQGYLRSVQDWVIRPQLRSVTGVAGIDSIGGYEKQFVVQPDPARLVSFGVSFTDLAEALEAANVSVGANFVERGGEAFLVRADGRIRTLDEISRATVANRGGVPVRVSDVASVQIGGELRTGSATQNGREVVIGTVLMLAGGNSRIVAAASAERLDQVAKSLPPGVTVKPVLDRSELVDATIGTVEKNLAEGALLVAAVLFWLLGNFRAAIIATLVIPISFLVMGTGMNFTGTSGNLMSLGALDFGLIVDGSIIIIENCLQRLAHRQSQLGRVLTLDERLHEVFEASREMVKPTLYGQAIIFLVFVPLLTFTGVEGKTFSPMAITVLLALAGAFVASLTFVPAMIALLIRGEVAEKEVNAVAWVKERYEPLLKRVISRPWPWIGAGAGTFGAAVLVFMMLGSEFLPVLGEGNLAMQALRIPSTSLNKSTEMQRQVERAVVKLPEVSLVYSKTGTAEVASDPMPVNASDTFIILKPKDEWPDGVDTKDEVIERVEGALEPLIGNAVEISQPIQLRFNELIAGVRGDIAIKVYGDDLEAMGRTAQEIAEVLNTVPGAADVKVEQTAGFPVLDVQFDRDAIARYGLSLQDVSDTVAAAMGGREAGIVFEGDRRYDIVVRLDNFTRNDLDAVGALPVMLSGEDAHRASVPLREVARFNFSEGLNQVSRENGKRRVVVQANVRGNDLGSFVSEAQAKVAEQIKLPPGSFVEWGGQFQNLQAASRTLSLVIPVIFAAIFGILFMALGGIRQSIAVYSAIPLALAGGVFSLLLTGFPFSVSAAVGFIVLSGVTVLNGLVVMTSINQRLDAGRPVDQAIAEGTMERVRAVLMTGIVPAIGFVPMAIATGTGAEVQKPLAIVVIGGLITSTLLTLFVLPAISLLLLRGRQKEHVPGDYSDVTSLGERVVDDNRPARQPA